VQPVAEELARFHAAQLNAQLRAAVGVDVVGSEPWLGPAIDEFTAENVALIKSIPTRFFDDLETHLKRELADGARWEQLTALVEERYGVAKSRAELIARDQAGKFFGDLNRVRQTDLGIERFVWRTMRDNRVREEHEERDGETYFWKDPPDGETPGEPVLCRCYAEPDLSGLLD
jgi:SPP1 gp7 family putative phage head morphogenesis protein